MIFKRYFHHIYLPTFKYYPKATKHGVIQSALDHHTGTGINISAYPTDFKTFPSSRPTRFFSYKRAGFTLEQALEFTDDAFFQTFLDAFRQFASEHPKRHIFLEWRPVSPKRLREGRIEWVLVADAFQHTEWREIWQPLKDGNGPSSERSSVLYYMDDLTKDTGFLPADKNFIKQAKQWVSDQTDNQTLGCAKSAGWIVKPNGNTYQHLPAWDDGALEDWAEDGRMKTKSTAEGGIKELLDLEAKPGSSFKDAKNLGGKNLNIRNYVMQSTPATIQHYFQGTLPLIYATFARGLSRNHFSATGDAAKPEPRAYVYTKGGSVAWLHTTAETNRDFSKGKLTILADRFVLAIFKIFYEFIIFTIYDLFSSDDLSGNLIFGDEGRVQLSEVAFLFRRNCDHIAV